MLTRLLMLLLLLLRVRCLLFAGCSCLLDPVGPVVLPVEGLVRVQVLLYTAHEDSTAGHTAHEHRAALVGGNTQHMSTAQQGTHHIRTEQGEVPTTSTASNSVPDSTAVEHTQSLHQVAVVWHDAHSLTVACRQGCRIWLDTGT